MTSLPESPDLSETRHEDAIMRLVDELASAARDAGWWASAPHMANAATAAEKRGMALRREILSALGSEGEDSKRLIPVRYEIASSNRTPRYRHTIQVRRYTESGEPEQWAVQDDLGQVFDKTTGEFEWEPQPSSRGDDFIARTRFASPADALAAYDAALSTPGDANA